MHRFDEAKLVNELAELSRSARIAFAAAPATRQLASYERFARSLGAGDEMRPRKIATQLWAALQAASTKHDEWTTTLDEVMGLIPENGEGWEICRALADDAVSSLAYAIRCLLTLDPQEAAWAARRAYEAADQAAIFILGVQPGLQSGESAIESHDHVQRELSRQRRDLTLLQDDKVGEVQRRALEEELLTQEEALSLK